jgi:hypothetical protein
MFIPRKENGDSEEGERWWWLVLLLLLINYGNVKRTPSC